MAAELNLPNAAGNAYQNLLPFWSANTLKAALNGFWQGVLVTFGDTFPEQQPNSHPVSNWVTVVAALADSMPASGVPFNQFLDAVQYVYRMCWMTHQLQLQGLITAAQATTGPGSILVQYNANF